MLTKVFAKRTKQKNWLLVIRGGSPVLVGVIKFWREHAFVTGNRLPKLDEQWAKLLPGASLASIAGICRGSSNRLEHENRCLNFKRHQGPDGLV